jgi:hypothetical protein
MFLKVAVVAVLATRQRLLHACRFCVVFALAMGREHGPNMSSPRLSIMQTIVYVKTRMAPAGNGRYGQETAIVCVELYVLLYG